MFWICKEKAYINWSDSNNSKTIDGGRNALNIGTNCYNIWYIKSFYC